MPIFGFAFETWRDLSSVASGLFFRLPKGQEWICNLIFPYSLSSLLSLVYMNLRSVAHVFLWITYNSVFTLYRFKYQNSNVTAVKVARRQASGSRAGQKARFGDTFDSHPGLSPNQLVTLWVRVLGEISEETVLKSRLFNDPSKNLQLCSPKFIGSSLADIYCSFFAGCWHAGKPADG
jgi:hypothetical protein